HTRLVSDWSSDVCSSDLADFFRSNAWFAHTDLNMLDVMASHGARVRALSETLGQDAVEAFIDRVLSVDNLLDASALRRARGRPRSEERRVGKECRSRWAA